MRVPVRPILAVGVAALLAGCGRSPPTILLTLDPVAPPAVVNADYRGPPVAVLAVHVPAALDRANFVQQVAADQAKVDDFARWAAPPGLLARDALVRDLTARLPAGSVLPPGATGTAGTDTRIEVTILAFTPGTDATTMQVAWQPLPGGTVRQVTLQTPGPAPDAASGAQAFAQLLAMLADRIATDLPAVTAAH